MFCNSYSNGKYGVYCDGNWINPDLTCGRGMCKHQSEELQVYDQICVCYGNKTDDEKIKVCNKCTSEYKFWLNYKEWKLWKIEKITT